MIVLQARMGSSRLPGKVLRPVAGTTILELMLDRLTGVGVGPIIVATSDRPIDDPIAAVARSRAVELVRGSEHDVLDRFVTAVELHPDADHVIRLTADCPLIDADVIRAVVAEHERTGADYTSNSLLRTYPDGLDVEVVRTEALLAMAAEADRPTEREHVTPFLQRHPDRFRLAAAIGPCDAEDERWTIDGPDDLEWLESLLRDAPALRRSGWGEILDHTGLCRRPDSGALVLRVARAAPTGDTGRPLGADLPGGVGDPGHRLWRVDRDAQTVGHLAVAVHAGEGQLHGDLADDVDLADALAALEVRLAADQQVERLRCLGPFEPRDRDALAAAGFRIDAAGAVLTRIPATDPIGVSS